MADEEIFDPSLKKKKKKKTTFDPDASGDVDSATKDSVATDNMPAADVISEDKSITQEVTLDDDFSLTKKKKKKKAFDLNDVTAALPSEERSAVDESDQLEFTAVGSVDVNDTSMDFSLSSKKKKKKKVIVDDVDEDKLEEGEDSSKTTDQTWGDTDRDYTYDELLKRVFDIMREKNPDMVAGEKKRFVMRPPQVMRVGTKKSSFSNFAEICKMLHRQPKHLLAFLLAELGTSGSIDGNNQLIIKGRFQQKQIESVLRRYIKEYVTCHTCRSPETILQKDTRLYFLQCETCGSRCSVASIKSGFQAVTGKRAAIRAKTA